MDMSNPMWPPQFAINMCMCVEMLSRVKIWWFEYNISVAGGQHKEADTRSSSSSWRRRIGFGERKWLVSYSSGACFNNNNSNNNARSVELPVQEALTIISYSSSSPPFPLGMAKEARSLSNSRFIASALLLLCCVWCWSIILWRLVVPSTISYPHSAPWQLCKSSTLHHHRASRAAPGPGPLHCPPLSQDCTSSPLSSCPCCVVCG